jgi:nucleoside-diphosphate-sugar epimerase
MAPRSAFVTGGTGFVGLNLIEQLVGQGWAVTALHRPTSDLRAIQRFPVRLVAGDLLDPSSLRRGIPQGVDALFHLAADISVWSQHDARQTRINVGGTRNVVDAALAAGVRRMVHTSTWNTYGLEQGEISEDSPQLGGRSWINYDRTKFQAEEAVREGVARGLDAVIMNPAHLIGRYDRRGWARLIIAAHRRWLPGVPPGAGTFCHAEEVVLAHITAALRGRTGQNYLLSGQDASFVELFRVINQVTGSSVPLRPLPAWLFRLSARTSVALAGVTGREPEATPEGVAIAIARARVVSRRAEQELGYRPAALPTMVDDSCRWLRSEGLVGPS